MPDSVTRTHARATGSLDERDGPPNPADPMGAGARAAAAIPGQEGAAAGESTLSRRREAAAPRRAAEAPGPVGPGNDRVPVGLSHARASQSGTRTGRTAR